MNSRDLAFGNQQLRHRSIAPSTPSGNTTEALMVAEPPDTPVTSPSAETVATDASLVLHFTTASAMVWPHPT